MFYSLKHHDDLLGFFGIFTRVINWFKNTFNSIKIVWLNFKIRQINSLHKNSSTKIPHTPQIRGFFKTTHSQNPIPLVTLHNQNSHTSSTNFNKTRNTPLNTKSLSTKIHNTTCSTFKLNNRALLNNPATLLVMK